MIARRGDLVTWEGKRIHVPVLVGDVLDALAAGRPAEAVRGWIVDATLGAAGHARAVLEAFPGVRLLGLDRDEEVLALARHELAPFEDRARAVLSRFSRLDEVVAGQELEEPVVGVLLDLGASSLQLDRPERGFSFQADGPLDMRMDLDGERTAAEIVNGWDEADLADLFYHEGGERRSRRIARAICEARRRASFQRTLALAELIAHAVGSRGTERIHPATRTFQALRRAVNEEGEELLRGLAAAERVLEPGGRLAVLSFHSGEDRIVKRFLAEGTREERWADATKKPARASSGELRGNPRARSARLRSATRGRAVQAPDPEAASREEGRP